MKQLKTTSFLAAFAVIALFSVKSFAAVNAYLYIEDAKGQIIKVPIADNGTFTSPALKAGTYTYSWTLVSRPSGSAAKFFGVGRGISSPTGGSADKYSTSSGGDRPTESVSMNFTKIIMTYEIKAPRDAASGMASGKRMHKPFTVTKELDRTSPTLRTQLGLLVVDADSDGITGKIVIKDQNGKTMAADDWQQTK